MKKLLTAYNKNHADLLKVYTEVIETRNVDTFFLDDVVDELIETHERLPSVYTIIQMVGKKKFVDGQRDKSEDDHKLERENKRFEVVRADCLKVVGEEGIEKFMTFWLKYVYGPELETQLAGWGVGKKLFEKSALFDLHEAEFDPKKAVAIAKAKMQRILDARENKKHYYPA